MCVSAIPPCLFRSVFACLLYLSLGGSLQVLEHPLKKSKESPEKCDNQRLQVDKRSWGVWDHAANKLVLELSAGGQKVRISQVN